MSRGGMVVINRLEGWDVNLTGESFDLLIECDRGSEAAIETVMEEAEEKIRAPVRQSRGDLSLIMARSRSGWNDAALQKLHRRAAVRRVWGSPPVFFVEREKVLFSKASEMIALAESRGHSLGQVALRYESELLGFSEAEVRAEMLRRWEVMALSVRQGLRGEGLRMKLLEPSAAGIYEAVSEGKTAAGGCTARPRPGLCLSFM